MEKRRRSNIAHSPAMIDLNMIANDSDIGVEKSSQQAAPRHEQLKLHK
jgi:hypothetical protein